ncbi:MAG TPA: class I SAM-dependent methyltransferase [Acidimicrobiales bacterium]|nr:class I SAM-dependent methyltransferase [Acidimicrobiales bacterium]
MSSDWTAWHREYDDPTSRLSRRLGVVQGFVTEALDHAPSGRIAVLSVCAGEGRDVIGVLRDHPRAHDVDAVLVEFDPQLAANAKALATDAGVGDHVRVIEGDAGITTKLRDGVPADVLLLCGIFGNISDDDVEHTVRKASTLCNEGATVVWTRHPTPPDLTVRIRQWFAESGFVEVGFEAPAEWNFGVGAHRLIAEPEAFPSDLRLFTFVEEHGGTT